MKIPYEFTFAAALEEQVRIDEYVQKQYRDVLECAVTEAKDRYDETEKIGFRYEVRMEKKSKILGCNTSTF